MAGYLPDEATAAAFDDGWYRTGDVGWLEPEGWVHLTDRCKEMIKVSGFQVAPAEIEAVLHGHPAVVDCAVFGVADERAGEVPVAAVQLAPGADVTAGELERLVADTLATYKRAAPRGRGRRHPPDSRRARCCAARCATSGPATRCGGRGRLMDVRLSPEQLALRDCGRQVVDRLGPARVADLDDRERAAKLDAAVAASGWRELRTADGRRDALGVGGRGRHRGRGARPGPGRRRLPGPDPGRRAAPPGRRAGGADPETVALTRRPRRSRPRPRRAACRRRGGHRRPWGGRRAGARRRATAAYALGAVALGGEAAGPT